MNDLSFLDCEVKMPLMSLPVRTTVVRLKAGLVMISPGSQLTDQQLHGAGDVTDLVAPNLFHCAGLPKAQNIFPNAKVWGSPGCRELRPNILWTDNLNPKDWPYQEELPILLIQGMPKVNETIFFHRRSKTLIVSDLCFNLQDARGVGCWIILNLFGTYRRFGVSRFWIKLTKDFPALENSLRQLFEWDFENIVMSHGSIVVGGGKDLLKAAFHTRGLDLRSIE